MLESYQMEEESIFLLQPKIQVALKSYKVT